MTSRRAFLIGISSALAAPAIVRADSLMKLWVPKPTLAMLGNSHALVQYGVNDILSAIADEAYERLMIELLMARCSPGRIALSSPPRP